MKVNKKLNDYYKDKYARLASLYNRKYGVDVEDLQQEAYIASVNAKKSFNPDKGMNYNSWEYWYVCNAMNDYSIRNCTPVSLSRRAYNEENYSQYYSSDRELDSLLSNEPSVEDLAFTQECKELYSKASRSLSACERYVCNRVVVGEEDLRAVAEDLGYSVEGIRKIKNRAVEKMMKSISLGV